MYEIQFVSKKRRSISTAILCRVSSIIMTEVQGDYVCICTSKYFAEPTVQKRVRDIIILCDSDLTVVQNSCISLN